MKWLIRYRLAAIGSVAILLAASLPACRGAPKGPPAPAATPSLALGDELPPTGTIEAASIYPLQPGVVTYLVIDEKGKRADEITITRTATNEHNARIAVAEGDDRIQFWTSDDAGNIVMTAVIERSDNALTFFDPPLVIAFNDLKTGEERADDADMRVMYASNPARQREHGTARRIMTYAADQRITTPLGSFVAKRVEVHFTADLGLADVDERSTLWVVPGLGILAETSREEVKVFGAFSRTKERTLVRTGSD